MVSARDIAPDYPKSTCSGGKLRFPSKLSLVRKMAGALYKRARWLIGAFKLDDLQCERRKENNGDSSFQCKRVKR